LGEYNVPAASQTAQDGGDVEDIIDLKYYNPDQNKDLQRMIRQGMRSNVRELNGASST